MTLKRLLTVALFVGGSIGIAYASFTYMSWPRYIIVLGVASLLMLGSTVGILLSERTPLSPFAQRLKDKLADGSEYTANELMADLHWNRYQLGLALADLRGHIKKGRKRNGKLTFKKKEK